MLLFVLELWLIRLRLAVLFVVVLDLLLLYGYCVGACCIGVYYYCVG